MLIPPSEIPTLVVTTTTHTTPGAASSRFPIIGRAFKISDNESPRPTDRAFVTYNYFNDIHTGDASFNLIASFFGFEKTFLNGDASIELRVPFLQTANSSGLTGISNNEIGDLTLIGKYAFINNRDTGNVASGGLAVTIPTAQGIFLADGTQFRSTLFQPFGGWIINRGDLFAQGFHSLVVPSDRRDVISSIQRHRQSATGCAPQSAAIPARDHSDAGRAFVHAARSPRADDLIQSFDIFTFTAGVNFAFPAVGSTFGAAFAIPVTGPRPNRAEAIVSFNYRF